MPDTTDTTDTGATADTPDLIANTGVNDPNSPWSGLLQTALTSGINAGSLALQNALQTQTPVLAPSSSAPGNSGSPAAATRVATRTWTPWLIGAVVLVILAYVFLGGRRG